ncbi:MAG: thymidylate synthase [Candidatus Zambryskibacteria bacterium CG10_big_fil_rev_8_21_14_0_10_42_12]|uniref:Thymidylate synthase n=1 Tax=Candidatus Zambryskibacteria bacterium CG10_big_fil_rev_8_21_14_0_10_42_12 TaxID=1975115 RepID=A0A2H0QWY1_9BACT|nr:MAG: thymidylate synthase [Candidatus Zambryskibacteria bacterium CG10_big_fil_rev_8_21_14_0_10_42_12]
MRNYLDLLKKIRDTGIDRDGRNGGTRALFAEQLRFNLADGFPAVTTKKLAFRSMAAELLWFMGGSSDNNELVRLGCNIWTDNANAPYWKPKAAYDGDLGRVYGVQWRDWIAPDGSHMDQLADVVERLKTNPHDRRLIVTAWNPGELDKMALPPCHMMFQFFSANNKLSLHMYQRSCDMFLGVPFNIASYALLLHLVAQLVDQEPYELILTLGDVHIYHNHFDAVDEQLSRTPKQKPSIWINPEVRSLADLDTKKLKEPNDVYKLVKLQNYEHDPSIKAEMAV